MARTVTFDQDKKGAAEYVKAMRGQDWDVLLYLDRKDGKWKVSVSQVKDGKTVPSKRIPTTMEEIMTYKEEEEAMPERFWPRQVKRIKKGAPRYEREVGGFVVKQSSQMLEEAATGKSLKVPLEHTSKRMDVVGGMKRSIPRVGTPIGAHTVFGKGSELPPAISEMKASNIAAAPAGVERGVAAVGESRIAQSMSSPRIAGGFGVPRESGFQLGTNPNMRFQIPRARRLTIGRLPETEEREAIEE